LITREIITKIGIIEAIPPLRACNSVKLPMLCERKMQEMFDVVLWRARAKRRPSCSGAPTETRLQLPALARYPKGYFRFFCNLYFYRLLNARMRAVVLFVELWMLSSSDLYRKSTKLVEADGSTLCYLESKH
jgi:hypothetical protein